MPFNGKTTESTCTLADDNLKITQIINNLILILASVQIFKYDH